LIPQRSADVTSQLPMELIDQTGLNQTDIRRILFYQLKMDKSFDVTFSKVAPTRSIGHGSPSIEY
jgi:hypothetical protein